MRGIAFWFFSSAVVYVTIGMLFGIWMSASHDHTLSAAHGHLNLVGWVTMGLFGVYYQLVPAAAANPLAKVHFALATLSVWLMFPGIILAIQQQTELLAILGSFAALLSMLTFLFTVVRTRAAMA
jgi:heme/copper-type cytochrome/quinol oxidase subunit 1